jgi:hypothetical protein
MPGCQMAELELPSILNKIMLFIVGKVKGHTLPWQLRPAEDNFHPKVTFGNIWRYLLCQHFRLINWYLVGKGRGATTNLKMHRITPSQTKNYLCQKCQVNPSWEDPTST